MTCQQIDAFLDEQDNSRSAGIPPPVAAHLKQCPRCRQLVEALQNQEPATPLSPRLQQQIESALLTSLAPVSRIPSTGRLTAGLIAVFILLIAVGLSLVGGRGFHLMHHWQVAGIIFILGACATLLATSMSRQLTPGSLHKVRPATLVLFLTGVIMIGPALLFPWELSSGFVSGGWLCGVAGLVFMIPAAACFLLLWLRGTVLAPALAGATTGLLAGSVGAAVLHFGCETITALHLGIWHGTAPAFGAAAGFLLGKTRSP